MEKEKYLESIKNVKVPLVVLRETNLENKVIFIGFVPGLTTKDIIASNKEDCLVKLKKVAKELVTTLIKNMQHMPYFPTNKEIIEDFENVDTIKYINLV